jgi:hypothetical protein
MVLSFYDKWKKDTTKENAPAKEIKLIDSKSAQFENLGKAHYILAILH